MLTVWACMYQHTQFQATMYLIIWGSAKLFNIIHLTILVNMVHEDIQHPELWAALYSLYHFNAFWFITNASHLLFQYTQYANLWQWCWKRALCHNNQRIGILLVCTFCFATHVRQISLHFNLFLKKYTPSAPWTPLHPSPHRSCYTQFTTKYLVIQNMLTHIQGAVSKLVTMGWKINE